MTQLNPFVKSALAFVALFAAVALVTFVSDVLVQHVAFRLDLAWAMGVAAGGAVILLVRELTANEE